MYKKLFFIITLLYCVLIQLPAQVRPIKILAIGNSFAVDGAEEYLDDLARADSINVIIGVAAVAGCTLEQQWQYLMSDTSIYDYNKIDEKGNMIKLLNAKLRDCIIDEDWDYITLQQASPLSGIYSSYFPYIRNLVNYLRSNARNANMKLAMHQTWAYSTGSSHVGFSNYGNNQDVMYHSIVGTVNMVSENIGIDIIIPSGTAIQNGRANWEKDVFCRDTFHLSYGIGRYIAACAWFETLLGKSVIGNKFHPCLSDEEIKLAQYSAHLAVKKNSVTNFKHVIK